MGEGVVRDSLAGGGSLPHGCERENSPMRVDIKDDGCYCLDLSYFLFYYKDRMRSKKLSELLGGPVREPEGELIQRHKDIAAAVQIILEEIVT